MFICYKGTIDVFTVFSLLCFVSETFEAFELNQ